MAAGAVLGGGCAEALGGGAADAVAVVDAAATALFDVSEEGAGVTDDELLLQLIVKARRPTLKTLSG
jgi:outer membrane lipoprotein SlyB